MDVEDDTEDFRRVRKLVDAAAQSLMEHAESVQIFVTIRETIDGDRTTRGYSTGYGNHYARLGSVQEWLWQARAEAEQAALRSEE